MNTEIIPVKPFMQVVIWTYSTSDGKSYQIISTGDSTGDTKRVLVKDHFKSESVQSTTPPR